MSFRKKYFEILGEIYEDFGFPPIQGWIRALLSLEKRKLTQAQISEKISEIMTEEDSPTSISSVNRALKTMETYGTIIKNGSRKAGYYYRLHPKAHLLSGAIKNFINSDIKFLRLLNELKESLGNSEDLDLARTINNQIKITQTSIKLLRECLELLKNFK